MRTLAGPLASFPELEIHDFQRRVRERLANGARLVSLFGSPGRETDQVHLNAVLTDDASGALELLRAPRGRNEPHRSFTPEHPEFHCFERECFEQYGLKPTDHPWLKPVRGADYPFYRIEGKEIHEVGVGPIHAGVIEPGHFRFMCYGETVHHLEIQLGFQHRGVENLLLRGDPGALTPLVETISGDSSIAHAWAYCRAWEALCGAKITDENETVRGIALELERIAMHLAGLAGICGDIAYLPGSSTYGRLRTTAINASMRLSGSRFGRGWLRPGEARFDSSEEAWRDLDSALGLLKADLVPINELFLAARTVRHRLSGTGRVPAETAAELGFVGMAARSAGVLLDLRARAPGALFRRLPITETLEESGDCWARARLRIREIDASLDWLTAAISGLRPRMAAATGKTSLQAPASDWVSLALVEGWRGEIMHCLQTDSSARLRHYKVQDPSLRNWFALALAVRENDISDFPVCNKSFDLSYCGQDL